MIFDCSQYAAPRPALFRKENTCARVSPICLGFVPGGLFGAGLAAAMSNEVLARLFGIVPLAVEGKMIFSNDD
jgi:uncharacterized membrane protein YfcA